MSDGDPDDYIDPDWSGGCKTHNWRNYIGAKTREVWQSFTADQRRRLMEDADDMAGNEVWE